MIKKKIIKIKKEIEIKKNFLKIPLIKTRIKIIAIGDGACLILSEICPKTSKIDLVAINNDFSIFKKNKKKMLKFFIDSDFDKEKNFKIKEKIKKLLINCDLVILLVCLAGKTGQRLIPVFAKIADDLGIATMGIFTLPFKFEGEKKLEIAKKTIQKIKPYLNISIVFSNEKIFQTIDKNTALKQSLFLINKNIAENIESLLEIIYLPGIINIDFADLKTILEGKGKSGFLNTIILKGGRETGVEEIKKIFNNPYYLAPRKPFFKNTKAVLFNILSGKNLSLLDLSRISKTIFQYLNPEAKMIFGIFQDPKYENKIKINLLMTGYFDKSLLKEKKSISKKNVILKEEKEKEESVFKISKKKSLLKQKSEKPKKDKKQKKKNFKIRVRVVSNNSQKLKNKKNKNNKNNKNKIPLSPVFVKPELPAENVTIRKNALEVKKEIETIENEILEKEKIWDTPAFLRKK